MTTHTAHPHHRFSTRTVSIAFAGAVLAAGAGYGAANLLLDEVPAPVITEPETPDFTPNYGPQPGRLFPGTDREERALMHLLR